jgi:hypothetical protein
MLVIIVHAEHVSLCDWSIVYASRMHGRGLANFYNRTRLIGPTLLLLQTQVSARDTLLLQCASSSSVCVCMCASGSSLRWRRRRRCAGPFCVARVRLLLQPHDVASAGQEVWQVGGITRWLHVPGAWRFLRASVDAHTHPHGSLSLSLTHSLTLSLSLSLSLSLYFSGWLAALPLAFARVTMRRCWADPSRSDGDRGDDGGDRHLHGRVADSQGQGCRPAVELQRHGAAR